ncbi:MAG: hypothetical protein QM739_00960 [Propionivibrio sp.]
MCFGFREATVADADMLTVWLLDHVAGEVGADIEPMIERLKARCRELAIEPPTSDRAERITARDYVALKPLIWERVTPCGRFALT